MRQTEESGYVPIHAGQPPHRPRLAPHGAPTRDNFRIEQVPLPEPGAGQVLLRTVYLSLDPYMRGRMSDAPSTRRRWNSARSWSAARSAGWKPRTIPGSRSATGYSRPTAGRTTRFPTAAAWRAWASRRSIRPTPWACSACPASPPTWACSTSASPRPARPWWAPPPGRSAPPSDRSASSGLPGGRRRRRCGKMPPRRAGARLRCLPRPPCRGLRRTTGRGLPGRHRHLLRERRRQGLRRRLSAAQRQGPDPGLRHRRPLQRHRPAARAGPLAGADGHDPAQAHQGAGLHHLRRLRPSLR